jgi:hypothetical protein
MPGGPAVRKWMSLSLRPGCLGTGALCTRYVLDFAKGFHARFRPAFVRPGFVPHASLLADRLKH